MTGFIAAPAEWAKVQRGVARNSAATPARLLLGHHTTWKMRRFHAAGLRSALFDSTFFGTEISLRTQTCLPPSLSYALAAALAVVVDFPLDAAVKYVRCKLKE